MNENIKKLLVVAFHYPPDNTSTGVLRTLKFTRYLLDHGWQSHVLTVTPDVYRDSDEKLMTQVPDVIGITRVKCYDAKQKWSVAGWYPSVAAIPDRFRSWRAPAVKAGLQLLKENKFDAIYSTYPHPTAHRIALSLKKKTALPWVADYRDPWAGGDSRNFAGWLDGFYEAPVVRHADISLANTELSREDFLRRYPRHDQARIVTLPNGYDEQDFAGIDSVAPRKDIFEIVHPGAIDDSNRNPVPLLEALAGMLNSGDLRREKVRLVFLGAGPGFNATWFRSRLQQLNLENITEGTIERIPYKESLLRLKAAGLRIVLTEPIGPSREHDWGFSKLMVPAKIYEYMRLGEPFLALSGEGVVPVLLDSTGIGWYSSPYDQKRIQEYIMRAYKLHQSGEKHAFDGAVVERYERRALAARLANILDTLTKQHGTTV